MKLYLHIGTEKTGSSFLQTYLARNRALLEKHGICYPKAGVQEANMKKGIISPGNASDLEKLLDLKAWDKIKIWMQEKKKEAQIFNCTTILLSNEILILRFSKVGVLSKFLLVLESIGIKCQGILLMIREPISQAMSLYKHRSKEGVLYPIEDWLEERYFIAEALENCYHELDAVNITLSQYPYKKDSQYLVDVCINQWLQLKEQVSVEHTSINPSLTLSELVLLCEIFKKDQILAKRYYDFMIGIDTQNKSNDKFYKNFIKNYINNYIVKYNALWRRVHDHMSIPTDVYHYTKVEVNSQDNITSFSPHQMQHIAAFIAYAESFKYTQHKTLRKFKLAVIKFTPKSLLEFRKKVLYS